MWYFPVLQSTVWPPIFLFFSPSEYLFCRSADQCQKIPKLSKTLTQNAILPKLFRLGNKAPQFSLIFKA